MRNFRAKCVCLPREGYVVDNHITVGKFYVVTNVEKAVNDIEYFYIVGDMRQPISRPSYCFKAFSKG